MALKNILETIEAEANQEMEKIKTEGNKKIAELRSDFAKKEKEEKESILTESKEEAKKRQEQEKFKAQNQKKSEILKEKQKVLDKVFSLATLSLSKLSEPAQIELLSNLIKKLPKEKEARLIPVAKSAALVKKANEKLGSHFQVSSDHIKGEGGFVFSSPTLEIDNRYESLINQIREETETEIAKTLFT